MTTGIEFTGSTLTIGANEFSTANRYPRQVVNAGDTVITMVQGPSIAVNATVSGTYGMNICWRYECGDLTFAAAATFAISAPSAGFAIDKPLGV